MQAVVDTCFLIDWAGYRRRELLKSVFNRLLVPRQVLDEVRSERTAELVGRWLSEGFLYLAPVTRRVEEIAEAIARYAILNSRIPAVEEPEVYGLALAKAYSMPLLTENRGAVRLTQLYPELRDIRVMRALEVLALAIERRAIEAASREDVEKAFAEYIADTKHRFPRKDLKDTVDRLCRVLFGS